MNKKNKIIFDSDKIGEVWRSISDCRGYQKCIDPWNREIHRNEYGKETKYGWNIDHVFPVSRGGTNKIENLQPLHWKSNDEKSDSPNCEKWSRC